MALVHKTKVTHYISPTHRHIKEFFHSLTSLYTESCHTDLHLVCRGEPQRATKGQDDREDDSEATGEQRHPRRQGHSSPSSARSDDNPAHTTKEDEDPTSSGHSSPSPRASSNAFLCFRTHQLMFASCSPVVRKLIEDSKSNDKCSCDNLTIMLPDYSALAVKNLLSIVYTGTSIGNCSLSELKSLINALEIDISKLASISSPDARSNRGQAFPDTEQSFPSSIMETSSNLGNLASPASDLFNQHPDDEHMDDEMLEVTPEVQMFFDGHFMAENGDDESKDSEGRHAGKENQHNGSSNLMEQSLQRFKEMARMNNPPQKAAIYENGMGTPSRSDSTDGHLMARPASTHSTSTAGIPDMPVEHVDSRAYVCRLCGKASGNGASLFAHLLYPHYAHLWRTEIPHRAARYDCKECTYTTSKRQHFVMHVARVHDDLRRKLAALGENLEVLDNLTQKSHNSNDRIMSNIAKGISPDDPYGVPEESSLTANIKEESSDGSPYTHKDHSHAHSLLSTPTNAGEASGSMDTLKTAALMSPYENINNRYPRGYKPFVKCRLCGKSWKGKDNFFTHLVSTHFKYMWANEVPKSADMYHCHVPGCVYQSKYRYNFLFHLAGKHKQLKHKLAQEGIPPDVLVPIETDGSELESEEAPNGNGNASLLVGSPTVGNSPADLYRQNKILMHQQKVMGTTPPSTTKSGGGHPGGKPNANNTRLICRVCKKMSYNHTCHRQHVVGKHFQAFWAHLTADGMGIFNCHHPGCSYKTPNRSVFVIHLAYVHSELKDKLVASGKDPNCANPDVYGKRKHRRTYYDSPTNGGGLGGTGGGTPTSAAALDSSAAAALGASGSLANQLSQSAALFGLGNLGNLGNGFNLQLHQEILKQQAQLFLQHQQQIQEQQKQKEGGDRRAKSNNHGPNEPEEGEMDLMMPEEVEEDEDDEEEPIEGDGLDELEEDDPQALLHHDNSNMAPAESASNTSW